MTRRAYLLAIVVLGLASLAAGQLVGGTASTLRRGSALPTGTCKEGDLFSITTGTLGLFHCEGGTWVKVGAGTFPGVWEVETSPADTPTTAAATGKSKIGFSNNGHLVTSILGAAPVDVATQTDLASKVDTTRTVAGKALSADVTLVKGDVGLGNVDNTSDANKPVSTATSTALAAKAPTAGPTFTGTVTFPLTGIAFQCLHVNTSGVLSGTGADCGSGSGSMTYPGAGIPQSTGSAWGSSLTAPTGALVGLSDAQTLTHKNLVDATNTFPTFNQNTTGTAGGLSADIPESRVTNLTGDLAGKAPTDSPVITGNIKTDITGAGYQCVHASPAGYFSGTGVDCGSGGSMVYPAAGIPVSVSNGWGTSKTAPSGALVGTTDTQTVTNKNFADASNTFPTFNQSTSGNAGSASAFDHVPTPCTTGQAPTGVLANGNSTGCFAPGAPANGVVNDGANTGTVSMTLDMHAASVLTGLKPPAAAGAAPTAAGAVAFDTTTNSLVCGDGSATRHCMAFPIYAGGGGGTIASNTTAYLALAGSATSNAAYNTRSVSFPFAGAIKNLCISTDTAQPGSNTATFTIVDRELTGGVNTDSAVTVTLATSAAKGTYCDTTHSMTVAAANHAYFLKVVNATGSASASIIGVSAVYYY